LAFLSVGQSVFFNKRYDNFNSCDGAIGVDTFNNKYLSVGVACTSVTANALNLKMYDYSNGTVYNSKTIIRKSQNLLPNAGKGIRINKDAYVICGTRVYKTDTSLAFQWKFNKNLDSVCCKEYGFLNQLNVLTALTIGEDNCIYMVGFITDKTFANVDMLLVKTDTSGNEIWKKKIGLPTWSEEGFGISPCKNGDLLISGGRYVPNYTSANQGPLITRIDTAGNVKWQKFFSSFAYSNGSFDVKELANGDIVFINSTARVVGAKHLRRFKFTKLDSLGNVIWDKVRGLESEGSDAYKFIQEPSGNYVLAALSSYTTNNTTVSGWAYKLDANGDSITSREYKIGALSQNYFRDLVRSPDNGYLFGGFIMPIPANGDIGTQDIWLLKTDSLLCEYQSCPISIIGVKEIDKSSYRILVYPNPGSNVLRIESGIQNLSFSEIEVTNSLGQIIFKTPFTNSIDISKLDQGYYNLRVISANETYYARFIKQ